MKAFNASPTTYLHKVKGPNSVRLELLDADGTILATASANQIILEGYHWRMECVEAKADAPSASFTGAQATAYNRWIAATAPLPGRPTDGFLSLLTPNIWREFGTFFSVAKPGQGATAKALWLFPGDTIDSPKLDARVYIGTGDESPGGPAGFVRQYSGGVSDNLFGAQMIAGFNFWVHSQGWGRGTMAVWVPGTSPRVSIRFYARLIWEPNPAPSPPCAFGNDW
jgi:hypothetical protein